MGIDVSGGMIVGVHGSKLNEDQRKLFWELYNEDNINLYAEYFDADLDGCYVGYSVPDLDFSNGDAYAGWLHMVHGYAAQFKVAFGLDASLIGCQNVY